MDAKITPFEGVDPDAVAPRVAALRSTFKSGITRDLKYRQRQLRRLYWSIVDNAALIEAALAKDLRRPRLESLSAEVEWCKSECLDQVNNMERWSQTDKVPNVPARFWLMKHRVRYDPLGVVLIIGAYNFPFMLTIGALLGAIAAGNCVVVKPSEASPACAMAVQKIMADALDPDAFACINGAVPVTKAVLDLKYDKILFTGGRTVGGIVARKAAETMTPVILELGGQNPAFVTANADVQLAAKRLTWQKCVNAGQICLSHNYVLVHRSRVDDFIKGIRDALQLFYKGDVRNSPDYSRIVNKANFDRIKKMLDNTKGKIVVGGSTDEDDLFIEPTVVLVDDINDPMMVDESFGPIWSVMAYDTLDQAIDWANEVDPTPLALFVFGKDSEANRVLDNVASGGATINDGFFHAAINQPPIGGIGSSGMGNYHGLWSFRSFSHPRAIARVPNFLEKALTIRYPPYTSAKERAFITSTNPGFDRNGDTVKGLAYWLGFLFRLGGKGVGGAVSRWGLLVIFAFALGPLKQQLKL